MSEPDRKSPITLCMLTRNEGDRVAAALGGVREHVERMIVLDAESDDRTRDIARGLGAEVVVREWRGFVEARRHVLSMVTTEWVIMIDADEVVEPELWSELERRGFPAVTAAGYQLRRRTVYDGRTLRRAFQPDWKTTLFRAESAYLEDRRVHEAVRVRGPLERLGAEILHHSYRSAEDQERSIRAYAELAARDLAERGERAAWADLWLRPAWRWFAQVVLLGGIVDGRLGIVMANRLAYSIHLRYRLLQRLTRARR